MLKVLLGVAIISVRLLVVGSAHSEPQTNRETYERVLNLVLAPAIKDPKLEVFRIQLRYLPSFEPEAQVTISQGKGQAASVEYLVAESRVVDLAPEDGDSGPESIARRVRVRRRTFTVPAARAFAWQAGLFASLHRTGRALQPDARKTYADGSLTITFDGDAYELRYEQEMTKFTRCFDPSQEAFGKWARALRAEIVSLADVKPEPR
jgi:hypothetical protein